MIEEDDIDDDLANEDHELVEKLHEGSGSANGTGYLILQHFFCLFKYCDAELRSFIICPNFFLLR